MRVICGNRNGIDPLSDQRIDHFNLAFSSCVGWTCLDDFDITEFSGSFFRIFGGSFKKANAQCFDNKCNAFGLWTRRRGHQCRHDCGGC